MSVSTFANLGMILSESVVSDVVGLIFNRPVATIELQQALRRGIGDTDADNSVEGFGGEEIASQILPDSVDAKTLFDIGERETFGRSRHHGDRARFNPTMTLIRLRNASRVRRGKSSTKSSFRFNFSPAITEKVS